MYGLLKLYSMMAKKNHSMLWNQLKNYQSQRLVIYQLSAEEWVDAMDKYELQVEAKKLGYNII